jgi:fructose-bisphosphate aldolase, class II
LLKNGWSPPPGATPDAGYHERTIIHGDVAKCLDSLATTRSALGHFNVADLVLLKAVVAAAVEVRVPVIVGASEGERDFLGTSELAALVKVMRTEHDVPIFLNADHTHSLARAVEAARAGFDAVVIDFSALPFDQNVSRTKQAVEAIKAINPAILAEGEIGNIGTGSEIHETVPNESRNLSTPEESRQFVDSTGIDALAPAVGNMHGMLESMVEGKTKKHLNIERMPRLRRRPESFSPCTAGREPMMKISCVRLLLG